MSTGDPTPSASTRADLTALLGGYRAEWLGESLFELFTAPDYLPELLTPRPCLLVGGRGTGKTTVLRGLSFEGQGALATALPAADWEYYGCYQRVNTNRVRAFVGDELDEREWVRVFSHYMNLVLCEDVVTLLTWLEQRVNAEVWPTEAASLVCDALHLQSEAALSLTNFRAALRRSRVQFEAYVNNIVDGEPPLLTMLGQPVDLLCEALRTLPLFAGKQIFFLIDEYENFTDYQQIVMNTLIKHSGDLYTFKVGVKDLGLRQHTTLNEYETLVSPADYELIEITKKLQSSFASFAERVCGDRLSRLVTTGGREGLMRHVLPGLSEVEEALHLGVESHVRQLRAVLRQQATDSELRAFDRFSPLSAYLVAFWSKADGRSEIQVLRDALADPVSWDQRLANYQHSMLFTLRRRRRGIHKLYAGWDTFTYLADGNIRYLLQLVFEALLRHLDRGGEIGAPIDVEEQTKAAQEVGRKNLTELEGLAVNGAQITRLVLGLGRIFQVMARQAEGHAPEVNQFVVSGQHEQFATETNNERVSALLESAVMHLALVRTTANKLPSSSGDTKEWDYSLHPILAAFFEFSYRKKRRMTLSEADILGIVHSPKPRIREILNRSSRDPETDLPEQLGLFAQYFNG